jgi:hypothetical protein
MKERRTLAVASEPRFTQGSICYKRTEWLGMTSLTLETKQKLMENHWHLSKGHFKAITVETCHVG